MIFTVFMSFVIKGTSSVFWVWVRLMNALIQPTVCFTVAPKVPDSPCSPSEGPFSSFSISGFPLFPSNSPSCVRVSPRTVDPVTGPAFGNSNTPSSTSSFDPQTQVYSLIFQGSLQIIHLGFLSCIQAAEHLCRESRNCIIQEIKASKGQERILKNLS